LQQVRRSAGAELAASAHGISQQQRKSADQAGRQAAAAQRINQTARHFLLMSTFILQT
jgi:hypothetical protein